jgi:hypothetical protein
MKPAVCGCRCLEAAWLEGRSVQFDQEEQLPFITHGDERSKMVFVVSEIRLSKARQTAKQPHKLAGIA